MAIDFSKSKTENKMKKIQRKGVEESNKVICLDIPLDEIDPNPDNSTIYKVEDIEYFANIIKEEGFTTPINVYRKDDGRYEISSGHRRYEASKLLKMDTIPCNVYEMPDEIEKAKHLISSNITIRNMSPMETARAIAYYEKILTVEKFKGDKKAKIAEHFNISESQVYRFKCLMNLIPELQEMAESPSFPYSAFRMAAQLSKEKQLDLYNELQDIVRVSAEEEKVDISEISLSRVRIEQIISMMLGKKKTEKPEETIVKEINESQSSPIEITSDSNVIEIEDGSPQIINITVKSNKKRKIDREISYIRTAINNFLKEDYEIENKKKIKEDIKEIEMLLAELKKKL